jgi:DNA (cytosine-5)-methyltransferase 1
MGYGERPGQEPRVLQLNNPLGTVTAGGNKFATVSAFLAKHYGGTGRVLVWMNPHTVTTVDHHAVVASHLVKLRGTCRDGQRMDVLCRRLPLVASTLARSDIPRNLLR